MVMSRTAPDNTPCYRAFCASEATVPLFLQDWWLDAVAPGQWEAALVKEGGRIVAAMPYVLGKRLCHKAIIQPPLTQFLGPWFAPMEGHAQRRLQAEKNLMFALIDQFPDVASIHANWHRDRTNWLPFHWRGFSQTTRYTYRLGELDNLAAVWKGLSSNARRSVRKAGTGYGIRLRQGPTLDSLLDLVEWTFKRQGRSLPYPRSLVHRIEQACSAHGKSRVLIAEDGEGNAHAGCYLVWDAESTYYLLGGADPGFLKSRAMGFVIWHAIEFSAGVSETFDFEGSMLEPVERFFRSFGAIQTPYFSVSKVNSRSLKAALVLRDLIKAPPDKGRHQR